MKKLIVLFLVLSSVIGACSGNSGDKFSVKEMQADMEEMRENYRLIHPAFRLDPDIAAAFEAKYDEVYASITKPLTQAEFFFELKKVIVPLNDGHAFVYTSPSPRQLPLRFYWLEEGLVVTESQVDGIERGDKVISIKNITTAELLQKFEEIISAENIYWVKFRAARRLSQEFILSGLGLMNKDKTVTLQIEKPGGETAEIAVALSEDLPTEPQLPLIETEYYPHQRTALFRLNSCDNSNEYREALAEFFHQVNDLELERVILDLRYNLGGDSRVIQEFISYLPVDKYRDMFEYGYQYNSSNKMKAENIFKGELLVATTNRTFSSAKAMTAIIKFNGLGKTIGEPTGNANIAYGHSQHFELTNSGLSYAVSTKKWVMPFAEDNYQATIMPDIPLPLTRQHILDDRDPLVDWIQENQN